MTFGNFGNVVTWTTFSPLARDPSLRGDELEIVYTQFDGTYQLYRASRASTADDFGTPSRIVELEEPTADNTDPALSADGLTLFFLSTRAAMAETNVWMTTRATVDAPFAAPVPVAELAATYAAGMDTSGDSMTLYLDTGGELRQVSRTAADQPFSRTFDVGLRASSPSISVDESDLFFTVNMLDDGDIASATRVDRSQRFDSGVRLVVKGMFDPEISHDGQTLYFSTGTGLAFARRSCE